MRNKMESVRCDDGNQYLRNQLGNKLTWQQSMIDHNKKRSYNEAKERSGEEKCPQQKRRVGVSCVQE